MMLLLKNKYANRLALMILALSTGVGLTFIFLWVFVWVYEGENYTDDDLFCKAKA